MDVSKCTRCWGALNTSEEMCESCLFKLTRPPRQLTWSFHYRAYPKKRVIQFKPAHDKANHFSIVWSKQRAEFSLEDFNVMDAVIQTYLKEKNGVLSFRIIRACKNCTYGRFDDSFEQLILGFRATYPLLCRDKDLTLDDPKHQFLKAVETWDETHPIIHHIHSESKDEVWVDFLRNSSRNSVLTLKFEL